MTSDATMRIMQAVERDPSMLFDFAAALGGDPDDYLNDLQEGPVDFLALSPAEEGGAFRVWLSDLIEAMPDRMAELADVDLSAVDWTAVALHLEQLFRDLPQ